MRHILLISHIILLFFFFEISLYSQSPYSLSTGREVTVFGSGIALGLINIKLIDNKKPVSNEELYNLSKENLCAFDRGAVNNWSPVSAELSNVLLITALVSPLLLFTSSAVRDDVGTFSTMYLQNILTTYSVSHLPKGLIRRYRPYAYNEDVPDEIRQNVDATHSFLSAHTAVAFASAVFLSTTFGKYNPDSNLKPYIWASSLLLATATGYLRYTSGNHFPTDIITGAIIGSIIGYLIPLIHENDEKNPSNIPGKISFNKFAAFSFSF
ncbi:MAG: phosphatase PAP2 family protein [Bacteroidetes bacterium]|nr:phosphatase PAP2 family protein [Bacteroidota bacterium]